MYDNTNRKRHDIIYTRVSTTKQKKNGDLDRRIQKITQYIVDKNPYNLLTLTDVGSGLNDDRKNLNKLLNLAISDKVNRIFILYKDRLTRFGFRYLEKICLKHNTEIIVISNDLNDKSTQEELAEDIISLIHSFSRKLYGMCKKIKQEADKIEDDDLSQTNPN